MRALLLPRFRVSRVWCTVFRVQFSPPRFSGFLIPSPLFPVLRHLFTSRCCRVSHGFNGIGNVCPYPLTELLRPIYGVPCSASLFTCPVSRFQCLFARFSHSFSRSPRSTSPFSVFRFPCCLTRFPCTGFRLPRSVYRVPFPPYCCPVAVCCSWSTTRRRSWRSWTS